MAQEPITFVEFARLVLDALEAAELDLIINKVYYFSLSQQTKHVRDIASIVAFCGAELDIAYIEQWVEHLGVAEAWAEIQTQANARFG